MSSPSKDFEREDDDVECCDSVIHDTNSVVRFFAIAVIASRAASSKSSKTPTSNAALAETTFDI